jgi:hypothetical protein
MLSLVTLQLVLVGTRRFDNKGEKEGKPKGPSFVRGLKIRSRVRFRNATSEVLVASDSYREKGGK